MGWFAFGKCALISGTLLIRGAVPPGSARPRCQNTKHAGDKKAQLIQRESNDASNPWDGRVLLGGVQASPPSFVDSTVGA